LRGKAFDGGRSTIDDRQGELFVMVVVVEEELVLVLVLVVGPEAEPD
jgi:hypothetical protein